MATLSLWTRWPTFRAIPDSCSPLPSSVPDVLLFRSHHPQRAAISCDASKPTATTTTTTGKKGPRGIMKPRPISPALQELVGVPEIPRTQALKQIWAYIKEKNLQDPDNKKIIICDEMLKKIFAGKERVGFLEISGLINPHFLK
ncbi:Upstream activation factor subunit [Nymphaea thermarum]|nr:Upstream activation factor subunit [Nymphaea thermarum]